MTATLSNAAADLRRANAELQRFVHVRDAWAEKKGDEVARAFLGYGFADPARCDTAQGRHPTWLL
jgi:hypothetical protein